MMPLLAAKNLSRVFETRSLTGPKSRTVAVDDVTLEIERNEVLAIVGGSGSGKTTLARMLLGLLLPSSGSVLFRGGDITGASRKAYARCVQPVFQDPFSSLNPRETIFSSISKPLKIHRVGTRAERDASVENMMDLVGLPRRFANRYPNQLSGGQRQRVAIARALILRPELLLCDEPTSALDVSVQAQILNLLLDLKEEFSIGMVLVTHDLSVVRHMADRIVVMHLGRIVEEGSTQDIFSHPTHAYTRSLLDAELTLESQSSQLEAIG